MNNVIQKRVEKLLEMLAEARCVIRPPTDNFTKTNDAAPSIWLSISDQRWVVNIRISNTEVIVLTVNEFMVLVAEIAASIRSIANKHASNSDKYSKRNAG
jgi:hypothetical protein